jgi:hypothetical protein
VFPRIIFAVALNCVAFGAAAEDAEQSSTEQHSLWFTHEQQSAQGGVLEFFASTRSKEDRDFWLDFSCLRDKRVYLSLGKFGGEVFHGEVFSIEIRFRCWLSSFCRW